MILLLIGIGYFICWIIASILVSRLGEKDADKAVFLGLLWPAILPTAIVIWFVEKYG